VFTALAEAHRPRGAGEEEAEKTERCNQGEDQVEVGENVFHRETGWYDFRSSMCVCVLSVVCLSSASFCAVNIRAFGAFFIGSSYLKCLAAPILL
jgi:hypothetical protein